MTLALAFAYLVCLYFAGIDTPHALIFATVGTLTGFLTLFSGLTRLTSKGRDTHAQSL